MTGRFFGVLQRRRRLLIPVLVVFLARLVGGLFFYFWLNMGSSSTFWMTVDRGSEGQNEVFRLVADSGQRWPFLFLGWDGAWYLSILMMDYGFSSQSYAFFPGLPFFGWVLDLVIRNPSVALVVFSNVVGLLCVPLFQLVAEEYLDRSSALQLTFLFGFSPYVFLFSTVAYSEGLFLLSTLSAWYFFKRKRMLLAVLVACVAVVSRAPGVLILLPMVFASLNARGRLELVPNLRRLFYFLVPVFSFSAWLFYCRLTMGDWLASFNRTGWNEMYSFVSFVFRVVPSRGVQVLLEPFVIWPFSFPPLVVLLLISALCGVVVFLIRALMRVDRALAFYSAVYFVGVLAFGGLASVPRFISFIFPLWLPFAPKLVNRKQSFLLTVIICASFYLAGLLLWSMFLNGYFVA